ncbi:MAG: DMT family transporter [Eubacterium sp.]|nr:DMT family transporter [Eubacterium sp.]
MPFLALLCAVLWALAYPLIKLGYSEIGIGADDIGSKILFAGIRFTLAGILVLLVFRKQIGACRKPFSVWTWLLLYAVVNITLHYFCSYVGLGYVEGARGSILNASGSFFLIILSCMILTDDRMSVNKVIGCVLGFGGIIFLNIGSGGQMFGNITFLGDVMMILNALCSAFGGIIGKILSRKMTMTIATGLSMVIGGAVLCVIGIVMKPAGAWNISVSGAAILIALTLISAIAFAVYNELLANHPISRVAIYNALIPVFGVVFSCIILKETFHQRYLLAGILVTAGILFTNRQGRKPDAETVTEKK